MRFLQKTFLFFNRVGYKDISIFSRQLSSLISAGVPISTSLNIIADQTRNKTLKTAVEDIASSTIAGTQLSAAMSEHPNVFSNFYIQLVKTGEVSGTLDKTTLFLAEHTERAYKTYHKVKSALTYPIFVIVIFVAIFLGVFLFVIPSFVDVLEEAGTELPTITKIMITISELTKGYWFVPLIVLAGVLRFFFTQSGKLFWDRIQLKIPVLGRIFIYNNIYRFSESFFILLRGGVPIVDSLSIAQRIVGNHIYQDIIADVREGVVKGREVAPIFKQYEIVPSMLPQMISIGEKTGKLDELMEHVAKFYEEELNTLIENVTSLIQPVLIILLGLGVGTFVLGILLPIFTTLGGGGV